MKTLRPEIFLLMAFFTSAIQSELRPDSQNVCPETETYEETVIQKVQKPVVEYKKKKCKLLKRCLKKVTTWKLVDEPRVVQKSRAVLKCCSGYREIRERIARCVPVCSAGCVHGECTAPDKCTCMPGFHGPTCNMQAVATIAKRDPDAKTSIPQIFQTTKKIKLQNLTPVPEIVKATKIELIRETTGGVTTSQTKATVTMIDSASYKRSTTELDEKEISNERFQNETSTTELDKKEISNEISTTELDEEISNEMFQNAKFTVAMDVELNLSELVTVSTEETGMDENYSNLQEAVGLENGVPNSSEELSTEGNEIPSNTTTISEFEQPTLEPPKPYGEIPEMYDFTSLFYILPISCLVLSIAFWIIVKRRKKIKESQKQHQFYSKEPLEFRVENLFWSKLFRNRSETSTGMSEREPNNPQSALLGLSQRNRSESPINMWEAGPNNAKPLVKDLRDCDRSHAIHSKGTCV